MLPFYIPADAPRCAETGKAHGSSFRKEGLTGASCLFWVEREPFVKEFYTDWKKKPTWHCSTGTQTWISFILMAMRVSSATEETPSLLMQLYL